MIQSAIDRRQDSLPVKPPYLRMISVTHSCIKEYGKEPPCQKYTATIKLQACVTFKTFASHKIQDHGCRLLFERHLFSPVITNNRSVSFLQPLTNAPDEQVKD